MPRLTLERALATWPKWKGVNPSVPPNVIEQLVAGLSNDSFLVEAGGVRYVLRLNTGDEKVLQLNPDHELQALNQAARANIAPAVIYSDIEQGILVTELMGGQHWQQDASISEANLLRLAVMLKAIHGLPPLERLLSPRQKAEHYVQQLALHSSGLPERVSVLRESMNTLMDKAQVQYPQRCCCHNDLLPGNIIDTGDKLYVIDWEYAAMNDPYFDLAAVAHGYRLNEHQTNYLLTCYAGRISDGQRRHFITSYAIYLYLECLWYSLQAAHFPDKGFDNLAATSLIKLPGLIEQARAK